MPRPPKGRPLWSGELGYGVRPAQLGQSDPLGGDVPADTDISIREVMDNEIRGAGVARGRLERVAADEDETPTGTPAGGGGH